ncbi:MAG: hypothetical protein V8Q84_07750 [Bilophila sp.]
MKRAFPASGLLQQTKTHPAEVSFPVTDSLRARRSRAVRPTLEGRPGGI